MKRAPTLAAVAAGVLLHAGYGDLLPLYGLAVVVIVFDLAASARQAWSHRQAAARLAAERDRWRRRAAGDLDP